MGLGSFRYFLAFLVLASHLWIGMPQGFAAYAVWGFFLLSGFLMTYVLNTKYGFTVKGLSKYLYNRALRIYPMYWISFGLGILSIYTLSYFSIDFMVLNGEFGLPTSFENWVSNFFLLPSYCSPNPVPVANALRIEVGYYLLMPFFANRKFFAWIGVVLGISICFYWMFLANIGIVNSFFIRYATFWPCLVSFSLGALLFHYRDLLSFMSSPRISFIAWLLHGMVWFFVSSYPWSIGTYVSLSFTAWVIISCYKIEATALDSLLGDLSYPIYLLHTTIGAWLIFLFPTQRSLGFMIASFFLIQLFCYALIKLVDKPLKKIKM